jgi:aminoglycoside 3'-phosphotransferase II
MISDIIAVLRKRRPEMAAYDLQEVTIGKSASAVYFLSAPERPALYLKVASGADTADLSAEHDRLTWLAEVTRVPKVVVFESQEDQAWLLTEALPGFNAVDAPENLRPKIMTEFGRALRQLHDVDPASCPFDESLDVLLPRARQRAMLGLVDESDFDAERQGMRAVDLLEQLYADRPPYEDLVISHGDAGLPNVIFAPDGVFTGFVDCGRSGVADRYRDIGLAVRSIQWNFGEPLTQVFLDAYGLQDFDSSRAAYFRLVDEFF